MYLSIDDAEVVKFIGGLKMKIRWRGSFAKPSSELRLLLPQCLEIGVVWLLLRLFDPVKHFLIFCRFVKGYRLKFTV